MANKKYEVNYQFTGVLYIEAESEEEAQNIWLNSTYDEIIEGTIGQNNFLHEDANFTECPKVEG